MNERPFFDLKDVGRIIGVSARTVSRYMAWSKEGGRYASRPFPKPDDRAGGRSPVWLRSRYDEILDWHTGRPGRGVGGGKPSHRPQ